jgi:hypothetical protein
MVPQTDNPDIAGLLEALRPHMRGVGEPIKGDLNRMTVDCRDRDGRAVDLQLVRLGEQSA